MKKVLFLLFTAFFAVLMASASNDRSKDITTDQLPAKSKTIISKHMGGNSNVSSAKEWTKNYSVFFKNGAKIEFFKDGTLKEAESGHQGLPKGLLNELNANISSYIKNKYDTWQLVDIDVDSSSIEIKLKKDGNTAKLEFSESGKVIKDKIKD